MVVLDATIVNIALHDIKGALGFSPESLSWVVSAYTLTFGGLLLLGARAGDLLGRRRVFIAGIALFSLASLAGGFAHSPGELLAARAIQGIGGALASPSALALLMTMFREGRERTRAIGLYTAVSIGGAAVGLIAGGMLSEWASWRWVLFVNVPIGAALLLLSGILPETERQRGRRRARTADALDRAGGEQFRRAVSEAAGERGEREQRDADDEHAAPAEQVTGAGAEQQQSAEGEGVRVHDPGQVLRGEPQGAFDVVQGDVDDGGVEHHHQLACQDHGEDEPGSGYAGHAPREGDGHEQTSICVV
jgi:hypothetical protein